MPPMKPKKAAPAPKKTTPKTTRPAKPAILEAKSPGGQSVVSNASSQQPTPDDTPPKNKRSADAAPEEEQPNKRRKIVIDSEGRLMEVRPNPNKAKARKEKASEITSLVKKKQSGKGPQREVSTKQAVQKPAAPRTDAGDDLAVASVDEGSFRQMPWADALFQEVLSHVADDDGTFYESWTNFQSVRAIAIYMDDEGWMDRSQRDYFVRNWIKNEVLPEGCSRRALVRLEGELRKELENPEEAAMAFARTPFVGTLLEMYQRREIEVAELKSIVRLWWAKYEGRVEKQPEATLSAKGKRFYRLLCRKSTKGKRNKKVEVEDNTLGQYTYLGTIRTVAWELPPGMVGAEDEEDDDEEEDDDDDDDGYELGLDWSMGEDEDEDDMVEDDDALPRP
ncbi:hypothetical protein B0T16DRAFT_454280 [Cercophora newfieldiana]|uniref:Uncharacterized protein n=1 Tax=Cercophora newfieldiana TaxID=92897 RepID=A0AA40CVA2_9PEZI|nr:hypothetical protein B0T16DRAFT_454280 [Cercophora newfieldiana]